MEFLRTIADALFGCILDANADDYGIITNSDVLMWILIFLFIVTIITVMTFYYGVAKVAANATKKNYIVVFFLGLLVLWLANLIVIPTIVDDWSYAFDKNNILLSFIDSIYYVVLYEIVSLFAKDGSNAKHLHLLNCFS